MLPPGEYKREVGWTCHSDSAFCQITLVLVINGTVKTNTVFCVCIGKLSDKMLRGRFQTAVLLVFFVVNFSLAITSEDEDDGQPLQCSATSQKQTSTDDGDDDSDKDDDEAPCVPPLQQEPTEELTSLSIDDVTDDADALAGTYNH